MLRLSLPPSALLAIMTSDAPEAPPGFVFVGPSSDFLSTQAHAGSNELDGVNVNDRKLLHSSLPSSSHLVDCPAQTMAISPVAISGERTAIKADQNFEQTLTPLIKVIEVPQPEGRYPSTKRVAVTHFHGKWYAFINICPHQGSALSKGSMTDIEDMGIVWGAGVVCSLHGWTFDAFSGQSSSTRFVIDTFEVKEVDGHVFVSVLPRNTHVQGQRRDFGGKELN
ncbi:hypothetical protein EMPS_08048 [Entomortierella parvispora]|uniref:Rieske domain-containing protein n=1 Tax=Entomortierella parvispora TaxID=205924 RepID=A0A9P3HFB6_9FUNG|nr:hypothetical protein EMPS_08048 [Entomortierella parvispora]